MITAKQKLVDKHLGVIHNELVSLRNELYGSKFELNKVQRKLFDALIMLLERLDFELDRRRSI